METITIPVKSYVKMQNPFQNNDSFSKIRFFVRLTDVPKELLNWMSTNPREQNLNSSVAKAISDSIQKDDQVFHLKNRGLLLSVESAVFHPADSDSADGEVTLVFQDETLHGDVDGGHTLRLILAAQQDETLPEQYVEFEVMTGLHDLLPIAEARNTSVALDIKTMEELKGSFEVFKQLLGNIEVDGDRFFNRVELKMNQQLEAENGIDIRVLISILLMFNRELYPVPENELPGLNDNPMQMYGNPARALQKYLTLGNGVPEDRNACIQKMAPILKDVVVLWDTIERELPLVLERKYAGLPFAKKVKNQKAMFSNQPMKYSVPMSILFPITASFRLLLGVDEQGQYSWRMSPIEVWNQAKQSIAATMIETLKSEKNNPNLIVKKSSCWHQFNQIVLLSFYRLA